MEGRVAACKAPGCAQSLWAAGGKIKLTLCRPSGVATPVEVAAQQPYLKLVLQSGLQSSGASRSQSSMAAQLCSGLVALPCCSISVRCAHLAIGQHRCMYHCCDYDIVGDVAQVRRQTLLICERSCERCGQCMRNQFELWTSHSQTIYWPLMHVSSLCIRDDRCPSGSNAAKVCIMTSMYGHNQGESAPAPAARYPWRSGNDRFLVCVPCWWKGVATVRMNALVKLTELWLQREWSSSAVSSKTSCCK